MSRFETIENVQIVIDVNLAGYINRRQHVTRLTEAMRDTKKIIMDTCMASEDGNCYDYWLVLSVILQRYSRDEAAP